MRKEQDSEGIHISERPGVSNFPCFRRSRVSWNNRNNRLVPNRKRSMSRLYVVTLLIQFKCRVPHEKRWTG